MLEAVFGNENVEKILLFLNVYGEGYGRQISSVFNIPVKAVQQQFDRLETGGVIIGQKKGRTMVYKFNPRCVFLDELKALLDKSLDMLPEEEIKRYYRRRTRPRRKGKPL